MCGEKNSEKISEFKGDFRKKNFLQTELVQTKYIFFWWRHEWLSS